MNIKELRSKKGLSQQDLADKTGIPRGRIAKWEEGKSKPKTDDYKVLENFFSESDRLSDAEVEYLKSNLTLDLLAASVDRLTKANLLLVQKLTGINVSGEPMSLADPGIDESQLPIGNQTKATP